MSINPRLRQHLDHYLSRVIDHKTTIMHNIADTFCMERGTAVALAKAGWPQPEVGPLQWWTDGVIAKFRFRGGQSVEEGFVYMPRLDELVEALPQGIEWEWYYPADRWFATWQDGDLRVGPCSTRDEAAAQMWLLINK